MKKVKYIYLLSFLLSLIVISCGISKEEGEQNEKDFKDSSEVYFDQVYFDFSADTLTEKQKEVFSKRAVQKLEDYYNSLEIINNKSYDTVLRNHAKATIKEFFLNRIYISSAKDSIYDISENTNVVIENATIVEFPKLVNDSVYCGAIRFEAKTANGEKQTRFIDFTIRKENKNFGSDQSIVWETYLGK